MKAFANVLMDWLNINIKIVFKILLLIMYVTCSLCCQAQLLAVGASVGAASPPSDVVKEKAKYASEQLAAAAKNAEQTLQ